MNLNDVFMVLNMRNIYPVDHYLEMYMTFSIHIQSKHSLVMDTHSSY